MQEMSEAQTERVMEMDIVDQLRLLEVGKVDDRFRVTRDARETIERLRCALKGAEIALARDENVSAAMKLIIEALGGIDVENGTAPAKERGIRYDSIGDYTRE